jgi:hypothetical protein
MARNKQKTQCIHGVWAEKPENVQLYKDLPNPAQIAEATQLNFR